MNALSIDWTINIGHIISIVAMCVGGLSVIVTQRVEIRGIREAMLAIATRLDDVEGDLKGVTGVLAQVARQDERLNSHDRRLQLLEEKRGP